MLLLYQISPTIYMFIPVMVLLMSISLMTLFKDKMNKPCMEFLLKKGLVKF
uniref:ATP synthase F0 subunit 8 n=1 Tax=Capillaria sp. cat-2018 TaxID=2488633 RepID=A0A6M2UK81_9BILA|nr:ATP synthase F0 subunit 8 [Capillaria sp. cat-2018]